MSNIEAEKCFLFAKKNFFLFSRETSDDVCLSCFCVTHMLHMKLTAEFTIHNSQRKTFDFMKHESELSEINYLEIIFSFNRQIKIKQIFLSCIVFLKINLMKFTETTWQVRTKTPVRKPSAGKNWLSTDWKSKLTLNWMKKASNQFSSLLTPTSAVLDMGMEFSEAGFNKHFHRNFRGLYQINV